MASLQGELADFAVAEYNANPTFIESLIAKGEGELLAFVTAVLANIKVGGLGGIVVNEIDGGIEKFAAAYVASHTPQQIYTEIGVLLASEAKTLGG